MHGRKMYMNQEKVIKEIIQDILQITDMDNQMDLSFETVGINSIDFIKIVVAIENELEIEVIDEALNISNYSTVGKFIERILQLSGEKEMVIR